jgi:hypothetical protein
MLAGPYSDELFAFACKRASSRGRVERQHIRFDVDSSPRSVSWNKGREEKRKKKRGEERKAVPVYSVSEIKTALGL